MSYRLLLDENVEHEIFSRLRNDGHDVERVQDVAGLGAGASDETIGHHAIETERLVVTYDDDFVTTLDEGDYRGVLFVPDQSLACRDVSAIIDEIARQYPQEQITGLVHAGTEWL